MNLRYDDWVFVAMSYNQFTKVARLYVGGEYIEAGDTLTPPFVGDLIVGGGDRNGAPGYQGHIDNLFVYADELDVSDLDFLRMYLIVGFHLSFYESSNFY